MRVGIDASSLDDLTKQLLAMPGQYVRARKSALASTGNIARVRMRAFVESGGEGRWKRAHPLTTKYFLRRDGGYKRSVWRKHSHNGKAFGWLGKFSRYRIDDAGTVARLHFGKSREGQKGAFDPFLMSVVKRAEEGETVQVTDKMRRLFGSTRRGFKNPKIGATFFPLAKETKTLKTEPRHIFDAIYGDLDSFAMDHFKQKFWAALSRYRYGHEKK